MKLNDALRLANSLYHGDLRWPDGTLKIMHPLRVMMQVEANGWTDDDSLSVALLHDVLEDFPEASRMIERYAADVLADIVTLTRQDGELYSAYINRVALGSNRALYVKMADLMVNMRRVELNGKHIQRYQLAMDRLNHEWLNRFSGKGPA